MGELSDGDENRPVYGIAEVAESLDVSVDTLRYYEKAGLLTIAGRVPGRHRRYSEADLDWITLLLRMRAIDMPIATIRQVHEFRRDSRRAWADELVQRHIAAARERARTLQQHATALAREFPAHGEGA